MSTILNTNGDLLNVPEIENISDCHIAILTAEWNPEVTHALRDGAVRTLLEAGMCEQNIHLHDVPGTVELVNGARLAHEYLKDVTHAVIVIGCVIRGDTPHFDYVCQIAAQGVADLNIRYNDATIFGVLTVENQQQALDRAGGALGNKGSEAAVAALKMMHLKHIMCSNRP